MPRTVITAGVIPLHSSLLLTRIAGDAANDHEFPYNQKQTLLVITGAAPTGIVTIVGVTDDNGRKQEITLTPAANKEYAFNLGKPSLFNQSDGVVHVDLDNDTNIDFIVIESA